MDGLRAQAATGLNDRGDQGVWSAHADVHVRSWRIDEDGAALEEQVLEVPSLERRPRAESNFLPSASALVAQNHTPGSIAS